MNTLTKNRKEQTLKSVVALEIVKLLEIEGHFLIESSKRRLRSKGVTATDKELHDQFMNIISNI